MWKYVLGVIALIIGAGVFWLMYGMGDIKAMSIGDVDLRTVPDGTHKGSFSKGRWTYNVAVTVKDHRITEIRLVDNKMKMAEKIDNDHIKRVLDKQSLNIDVVTGATVNAKALLKAVENALSSSLSR